MLLFCLLGVILVFGGLTLLREVGTILTDVRLAWFGVRVRNRNSATRPLAVRPDAPPLRLGSVPPPTVVVRPRR